MTCVIGQVALTYFTGGETGAQSLFATSLSVAVAVVSYQPIATTRRLPAVSGPSSETAIVWSICLLAAAFALPCTNVIGTGAGGETGGGGGAGGTSASLFPASGFVPPQKPSHHSRAAPEARTTRAN